MNLKHIIYSFTALVLLLTGCEREVFPGGKDHGEGGECTVTVSLSTVTDTKASGAKDGDAINNIYVWIANGAGNIVYKGSYDGTNLKGDNFSCSIASGNKKATAQFTNVERGDYTLYVVANLPSSLSSLASKTSVDTAFENAVLPALQNNIPPFSDSDGMPMSMVQSIHVGPGMNEISTQLVRVCGRIRVTVRNMTTDHNIFLQSFALTDKNPSTGYLFHKADHGIPAGTTFGKFASYELTGTQTTRYIAPGGEDIYIDQYLYETGLTGMGTLGFEVVGGIYNKSVTSAEVEDIPSVEAGAETTTYQPGVDYLIKNASGNFYLTDNGSGLSAAVINNLSALLVDASLDDYLWNFSSQDKTVSLQNVGSGKYMSLSSNSFSMKNNGEIYVSEQTNGLRFSPKSSTYYYGLYYNQGLDVVYAGVSAMYCWKLIPVQTTGSAGKQLKDAIKVFNRAKNSITYIDQFGLPVTLEHICRNDDVNVVINVFYSPESGVLYFKVQDWTDVSNNTTFD